MEPKYPLKFSYDMNAVYEDLPASQDCEHQGYFYPDLVREELTNAAKTAQVKTPDHAGKQDNSTRKRPGRR